MAFYTDGVPAWNSLDDNTRAPLASELEGGYPCGEADQALFNWTSGWPIGNIWNMLLQSGITPDSDKLLDLARAIQAGKVNFAAATGTPNAITATLSPVPQSLYDGLVVVLNISNRNTGAATLNVNGLGVLPIVNLFGAPLVGGEMFGPVRLTYLAGSWWGSFGLPVLTGNRSFYVNAASGNDGNDGLTTGTAFATIQRAVQQVQSLNLNGYSATINVANGTYAGPVSCGALNGGTASIVGNPTTPSACYVTQAAGPSFVATAGQWSLDGFSVSAPANGSVDPGAGVLVSSNGAQFTIKNMLFSPSIGGHVYASFGGRIVVNGKLTIVGQAPASFTAAVGGTITFSLPFFELAIPNSFAMTEAFALSYDLGSIWGRFSSITGAGAGSVTGPRYQVSRNGVIDTLGAGANYFPGNSAGQSVTGGQYA